MNYVDCKQYVFVKNKKMRLERRIIIFYHSLS